MSGGRLRPRLDVDAALDDGGRMTLPSASARPAQTLPRRPTCSLTWVWGRKPLQSPPRWLQRRRPRGLGALAGPGPWALPGSGGGFSSPVGAAGASLPPGAGGGASGDAVSAGVSAAPTTEDAQRLAAWWGGPTLLGAIDALRPPPRGALDRPLRLCISDVYRSPVHGLTVAGRVEGGYLLPHTRLALVPSLEGFTAKGVAINGSAVPLALAGESAGAPCDDARRLAAHLSPALQATMWTLRWGAWTRRPWRGGRLSAGRHTQSP